MTWQDILLIIIAVVIVWMAYKQLSHYAKLTAEINEVQIDYNTDNATIIGGTAIVYPPHPKGEDVQ